MSNARLRHRMKNYFMPAGMLTIGLLSQMVLFAWRVDPVDTTITIALWVSIMVQMMLVIGFCWILSSLLNIPLGSLGSAVLKLAAIVSLPGGIAMSMIPAFHVVGLLLFLIYTGLVMYLFELTVRESWPFALVIVTMEVAATIVISWVIFDSIVW